MTSNETKFCIHCECDNEFAPPFYDDMPTLEVEIQSSNGVVVRPHLSREETKRVFGFDFFEEGESRILDSFSLRYDGRVLAPPIYFGSSPDCDIAVDDPELGQRQLAISYDFRDSDYVVKNLGTDVKLDGVELPSGVCVRLNKGYMFQRDIPRKIEVGGSVITF